MERYHDDCARCCAAGKCHFCATAPGRHQVTGENGLTYRVCTTHLAFLANCEYAPKVDALPAAEIPARETPATGTGARMIEIMNVRGELEPPALLR